MQRPKVKTNGNQGTLCIDRVFHPWRHRLGFAFVYWLQTTGSIGKRTSYEVRFSNSVSGLLTGSAVLFNGIRVGEVTDLKLVPGEPRLVDATISIDARTPVKVRYRGLA